MQLKDYNNWKTVSPLKEKRNTELLASIKRARGGGVEKEVIKTLHLKKKIMNVQ